MYLWLVILVGKYILKHPFIELSAVQKVFSGISNYDAVLKSCPELVDPVWKDAASKIFNSGWTECRQEIACRLFVTEDSEVARIQIEYLNAWLGSYQPSHHDKLRVSGWLMSLMFLEYPIFTD